MTPAQQIKHAYHMPLIESSYHAHLGDWFYKPVGRMVEGDVEVRIEKVISHTEPLTEQVANTRRISIETPDELVFLNTRGEDFEEAMRFIQWEVMGRSEAQPVGSSS